jgi:O-succinylbenzoate synthase
LCLGVFVAKIDCVELFHLRLPLVHFFETSFGRVHDKETVIVAVRAGGITGWGEAPAERAPYYSPETVETQWHVLRDFLVPALLSADEVPDPAAVPRLSARVRGHAMAKAGLEMAVWDLAAKARGTPLGRMLGGTQDRIPTGISLGIEDRVEDLMERIGAAVAKGYRRVKIKIKPGWDVDVVEAVRARFPDVPLMVDANSAYTLQDAEHLAALDRFHLMMIEQPLAHDDIIDHAALQKRLATPICLDESIHSAADGRKAIELGACRIVNIKQARVGGPTEAKALHDVCRDRGVPVWCGGLLETGIGRAHNIALATLPNFTLPGDISASDRYWTEDVIDPPVTLNADGTLTAPSGPGIGFAVVEERVKRWTVRKESMRGNSQ